MSREVKFRAINADGDWCYGLPYYDADGDLDMSLKSGYSDYGDIEKTLGQYTGLKDKNGVEIYEGDIVASHEVNDGYRPFIAPVVFDNAKWMVSDINSDEHDCLIEYHFDVEVIGNIHQNPELLN